jgi:hypothetical protein
VAPGKSSCQPWDVPLAAHARICFVVSRFIGENRGVNFIRPQLEAIIPLAKASKVTDAFPGPQTPDQSLRPTADPKSTYTLALFISGDNSARTLTEITLRSLTAKLKWTAGDLLCVEIVTTRPFRWKLRQSGVNTGIKRTIFVSLGKPDLLEPHRRGQMPPADRASSSGR